MLWSTAFLAQERPSTCLRPGAPSSRQLEWADGNCGDCPWFCKRSFVELAGSERLKESLAEGQARKGTQAELRKLGLVDDSEVSNTDSKKITKNFAWLFESECCERGVRMRVPSRREVSALVHAPIGYDEEELQALLEDHYVATDPFGRDGAKTLKEFSEELIKGEAHLQAQEDGSLVRVVDQVLLLILRERFDTTIVTLVEASSQYKDDNGSKTAACLPGSTRRPNENHLAATRRIIRRELGLDPDQIILFEDGVKVVQEEQKLPAYPGLSTVFRKRIVSGAIDKRVGRRDAKPAGKTDSI